MLYYFLSLFLLGTGSLFGMSSAPEKMDPVYQGTVIKSDSPAQKQTTDKTSYSKDNNSDMFPEGNQQDINKFNQDMRDKDGKSILTPQSFDTGSNSYWLQPDSQMGPGSVNDFGDDPNAEQIVGPYIN